MHRQSANEAVHQYRPRSRSTVPNGAPEAGDASPYERTTTSSATHRTPIEERQQSLLERSPESGKRGAATRQEGYAGKGESPLSRQRILRTRARFDCPRSVVGIADVDPELVDKDKLTAWLVLAGRRVGLGDWRPKKSG